MNTLKKIVRDFTFRTLMRKFPRSSFSVFKKVNLEPDAVTASDATDFLRHYAFDEAWIFHGIAMEREGKAIVVSGPPGIGKSTLLRKCAGSNMAKPLDDGFILVGKAENKYYVVESGLYLSLRTISVLSKFLKIVCRCRVPYGDTAGHPDIDKALARGQSLSNLAVLLGAVVARDRGSEEVASSPVRLIKVLFVTHQKDRHLPRRVRRDTIERLGMDTSQQILNQYVDCEVIPCTEPELNTLLYDRVKNSI